MRLTNIFDVAAINTEHLDVTVEFAPTQPDESTHAC